MYHFTCRKMKKFNNIKNVVISRHLKKFIIFSHSLHKEMWQWLSNHPDKHKRDWPRWKRNGGNIENISSYCFGCNYNIIYKNTIEKIIDNHKQLNYDILFGPECKNCPFIINIRKGCLNNLYIRWCYSSNLNKKRELALQIKNFRVKRMVKCV